MDALNRRELMQASFAMALHCCDSEALPMVGIAFREGLVSIDLRVVKALRQTGRAFKIVNADRKIDLILAHPVRDRWVALERTCTHGGGPVAYNRDKRTVQCTCWGQSEFDLSGRVLFGPAKRPLRVFPVEVVGEKLEIRMGVEA